MERTDVAVVGGGIAGASLAYHLAQAGVGVHVLERAPGLGAHASGRNAGLVLQPVLPPLVRAWTAASARVWAERAGEVGFQRDGSLLLATRATLAALRDEALFESELLDTDAVPARMPSLSGPWLGTASGERTGLWTPGDGVLDPERVLAFFVTGARAAGARVDLGAEVHALRGGDDDGFELACDGRTLRAARVVVAAGAWANEVAACAGSATLPLVAYKRHLFLLGGHRPPAHAPYVWDLGRDVYWRTHAEGVLACFCDEEPTAALAETITPGSEDVLRERLAATFPWLADAPLVRAWSCFRTKTPDLLPAIGPDPRVPGLHWLAGLGGYGLCTSWEVGRLAARGLIGGDAALPAEVLPARFATAS